MLDNETFEGIETETAAQAELVAGEQSNTLPTSEVAREAEPVAFNPETGEVTEAPKAKRAKRTEAQMIKALGGSSLKEASYVLDRVAKLEEKISELMGAISQKGRERVLEERPELSKY